MMAFASGEGMRPVSFGGFFGVFRKVRGVVVDHVILNALLVRRGLRLIEMSVEAKRD
jgi:hypothetical protein